jgi:TatD DNase family protein
MQLVHQNRGFMFATASVHPEYVKEVDAEVTRNYFRTIKANQSNIVAIGETGLDYNWIKEVEWRRKQKQLFVDSIALAESLRLPLVIHSRDACEGAIDVLEEQQAKSVQLHMFTVHPLLPRVIDNGWMVSVNTFLLRSKSVGKIVRDCPLEHLMLETDSPWLGIGEDGNIKPKDSVRNDPTAVALVAEKVATVKKVSVEEVDKQTTKNAKEFFRI